MTYGSDLRAAIDATELLEWACVLRRLHQRACACGTPRTLAGEDRVAVSAALSTYGLRGTQAG